MNEFKLFGVFFFSLIMAILIVVGGLYAWGWVGEFIAVTFGEGATTAYFSISLIALCAFLMTIMVEGY